MDTSLTDQQVSYSSDEPSLRKVKELSAFWPTVVIVFILNLRLLESGWPVDPLCIALTLSSLFVLLFDPTLTVWKRSHRSPLYLPYSMALCGFIVGWVLLTLSIFDLLTSREDARSADAELALLWSLNRLTYNLVIQVGLGWLAAVLLCLWIRRGLSPTVCVQPAQPWRQGLLLLFGPTVLVYSGWLFQLWWCGSQLAPDLLRHYQQLRTTNPEARVVEAVRDIDRRDYRAEPDAPRPICASAVADMPPAPEILKWPKRARLNARWRGGEFSQ